MYEILDQDSSSKSAKAKRVDIFAKKIEEHEGRKRPSIRVEISNRKLPISLLFVAWESEYWIATVHLCKDF